MTASVEERQFLRGESSDELRSQIVHAIVDGSRGVYGVSYIYYIKYILSN